MIWSHLTSELRAGIRITIALLGLTVAISAQSPVGYRLSFRDKEHHVMQVDAVFGSLPARTFRVQMSRSSPGRYASVEFAKNVFDVHFTDSRGRVLTVTRPNPRAWDVAGHDGTIRIQYSVFGDRVDGTFVAIDSTHAHLNMPAVLMWAPGLEDRPADVTFVLPVGSTWKVATQLYPTEDPLIFHAPNLQYLMDSPAEVSDFVTRTFTVAPIQPGGKNHVIRIAMHHLGTDADLDSYTVAFEKIVYEEQSIFGELPDFEPGYFTLLADYLPWADFDGMEHRNSSVISSGGGLVRDGIALVGSPAHEFFHCWNIKRIRPASLEPFNFTDVNMSDELWLAEGFTNYYSRLVLMRTVIRPDLTGFGTQLAGELGYVLSDPAGRFQSAVEGSRLAPFVDTQSPSLEPTDWSNTFINYYSFGDMIALGLDLTLRDRSNSRITLDDFMRAMWRVHGKPGGPAPGLVTRPYTISDVQSRLAEVTGDRAFAADFVGRYIQGTERIDYPRLLLRAGFVLRKKNPGDGTLGILSLEKKDGALRITGPTIIGSPAYVAGLDMDDQLISVAGVILESPDDLAKALAGKRPGEEIELVFKRHGREIRAIARLAEDQKLEAVPIEKAGGVLTDEQSRFRDAWLKSKRS